MLSRRGCGLWGIVQIRTIDELLELEYDEKRLSSEAMKRLRLHFKLDVKSITLTGALIQPNTIT